MAPLSTCTRSRLSHIPSYLLRREAGHSGAPTCTPSHTQPLPPQHLAGVLFLSSPASPNEAHAYVLSAPQALLVAANRPKDTGPAHRLLPFFFGTCFGALGLAAWEANAHPAPPSPHQALHTHQGLHTQPPGFSWLGSQPLSNTPTNSANTAGFSASTSASTLPLSSLQHLSSSGIDGITSASGSSGSAVPSGSSSGNSSSLGSALSALASGGSSLLGSALRWPGLGAWGHHSSGSSPPGAEHTHSASPPPLPPISNSALPPPLTPPQTYTPTPTPHPSSPHPTPQPFCASSLEQQQAVAPMMPLTRTSICDASSRASPAVVHLLVEQEQGVQGSSQQQKAHSRSGMGGMNVVGPGRSSGSGFVYDERGYILTNAHVVAAAAEKEDGLSTAAAVEGSNGHKSNALSGWGFGSSSSSSSSSSSTRSGNRGRSRAGDRPVLTVTLQDGRILQGRVVCLDRAADVAVVKVDSSEPLPVAPMGSSSKLRVGEWVVALGSPLMLKHSVTAGIVSCVERRGHELGLPASRSPYIQTDVAINQGNSGGPLINLDGEVVGMSMMKAYEADGVSFCLPISTIQEIVASFATHGRMRYPYVGITMVELTQSALKHLQDQLPSALGSAPAAVMIQSVREGSPAQAADLQPEDLIVSIDGRSQLSMNDIVEHFGAHIQRPCSISFMRRATNADGSRGPYTLMSAHLTPEEVPLSDYR